jgi:hypothetical protein
MLRAEALQSIFAAARVRDFIALRDQRCAHYAPDLWFVVNDQNGT